MGERESVVVVGAGPAGLAVGAALKQKGISALLLDETSEIGASWMGHYDRLHLHTVRWLSHLPGYKIPRREGKWVPRDGVVRYLKDYARYHDLRIQLGSRVDSIAREDGSWKVGAGDESWTADAVIIATGYNREPVVPDWPGADSFAGELIHSSKYRTGASYRGKDVLVVGTGNSGAEIAVDLAENGARKVWLSVKTPPNILRRDLLGFPTQVVGIGLRKLPVKVVDKISLATQRLTIGDLSRYGLSRPEQGVYTRASVEERIPLLDVGLIKALKKGHVEGVPAVVGFEGADVLLDGDRRLSPDAVIAATGYRRGLTDLVSHLGVLDEKGNPWVNGPAIHPKAPNLYFIGYSNPISGNLRELNLDAQRIARGLGERLPGSSTLASAGSGLRSRTE